MGVFGSSIGSVVGGFAGGGLGGVIGKAVGGKKGKKVGKNLGKKLGGIAGTSAGAILPFKQGGRVPSGKVAGKKNTGVKTLLHGGEYILPYGVKPTKAQMKKVADGKKKK